jgi:hypothetical protein
MILNLGVFKKVVPFIPLLALLPSLAHADAGVPMIFVTFPYMCMALIPIIFIEAWVLKKSVDVKFKKAFWTTALSNVVSTVVGIPLTWGFLVGIQMLTRGGYGYGIDNIFTMFLAVTWQAPWLIPYENELYWMVPTASFFLLVPFFYASWWIEYWTIRFFYREIAPPVMKHLEFKMNLYSYSFLAALNVAWLIIAIIHK